MEKYHIPMLQAVKAAIPIVKKHWQENPEYWIKNKDVGEMATHADFEAETAISQYLMEHTDIKQIWGEETANSRQAPPKGKYWVIDPIDGTHNFISGIPFFGISLALAEDNKVLAGVVADPMRDKIYTSWQIKKIHDHSGKVKLILLGYGYSNHQEGRKLFDFCISQGLDPRALGTAALMLSLAATDPELAVISLGVKFYDIAGGLALVEKSGKPYKVEKQGGLYSVWVGGIALKMLNHWEIGK